MNLIDINTGRTADELKLNILRKSFSFEDYVSILEYCLLAKKYDCKWLEIYWIENKSKIQSSGKLDEILNLFCCCNIKYDAETLKKNEEKYRSELDPKIQAEVNKIVKNLVTVYQEREKEREPFIPSYSWFSPAINIAHTLEPCYPDDLNPGKVIGKAFQSLFPETLPDKYKPYIFSAPPGSSYEVPQSSTLFKLISEAVLWGIKNSELDQFLRTSLSDGFHDLLGKKRTGSVGETIVAMLSAPTDFFRLWLDGWLLNENNHRNSEHQLTENDFFIALLCIPFGVGNKPLLCDSKFHRFINQKNLLKYFEISNSFAKKELPFGMIVNIVSSFDYIIDTRTLDNYTIYAELVSRITKFRTDYLSGIFPLEPCDKTLTWLINWNLIPEDNDLLLLLSSSSLEESDELSLLPERNDMSFHELCDFYNSQREIYFILVQKSYSEGRYDLGTALLSLYLLYRSIFLSGDIGPTPDTVQIVSTALSNPGNKILKQTISIIVNTIDEHFAHDPVSMSSADVLRQHLPKSAKLYRIENYREKQVSGPDVITNFKCILDISRWDKLSKSSQECLISAELQWRNNAIEFAFGIKDWSGLVITYFKAIERELVDRFKSFYTSTTYLRYLTSREMTCPQKATAGWLLKELRNYQSWPQELKDNLSTARINLHNNPRLVNNLYDLCQNYRNVAAHPDPLDMVKFTRFKKILFEDRVIHDFIDSFCN